MAFTGSPVDSTEYAKVGTRDNDSLDTQGLLQVAFFSYTHTAGAGIGEVNLCSLPPGRIRIMSDLSRLVTSQFAASADLHIGTRAFTNEDETAVAEDDNRLADNLDAGGGALDQVIPLPSSGAPWHDLNSTDGIDVYAMIDTGNIEDTDTIHGYIVYAILA